MGKNQKARQKDSADLGCTTLHNLFEEGNFWLLRRKAHETLTNSSATESARSLAQHMLYATTPDGKAMLAGLVCLAFSVTIAFLVAY